MISVRSARFFANRKLRREKMLHKLANMRAAKARIRQERIAAGLLDTEPKMQRYYPLEIGVRDKQTGTAAFIDFKSVRDAARRLAIVQKFYVSGPSRPSPLRGK